MTNGVAGLEEQWRRHRRKIMAMRRGIVLGEYDLYWRFELPPPCQARDFDPLQRDDQWADCAQTFCVASLDGALNGKIAPASVCSLEKIEIPRAVCQPRPNCCEMLALHWNPTGIRRYTAEPVCTGDFQRHSQVLQRFQNISRLSPWVSFVVSSLRQTVS